MHTYPNDDIKLRKAMRLNNRRRKATKKCGIILSVCFSVLVLTGLLNNWGILSTSATVLFMLTAVGVGGVVFGSYIQFMDRGEWIF